MLVIDDYDKLIKKFIRDNRKKMTKEYLEELKKEHILNNNRKFESVQDLEGLIIVLKKLSILEPEDVSVLKKIAGGLPNGSTEDIKKYEDCLRRTNPTELKVFYYQFGDGEFLMIILIIITRNSPTHVSKCNDCA